MLCVIIPHIFISIFCICIFVCLFSHFIILIHIFKNNVSKVRALEFIDMLYYCFDSYSFLLYSLLRLALLLFLVKCWIDLLTLVYFRRHVKLTSLFISKYFVTFISFLSYKFWRISFLSIQIYVLSKMSFLFI